MAGQKFFCPAPHPAAPYRTELNSREQFLLQLLSTLVISAGTH